MTEMSVEIHDLHLLRSSPDLKLLEKDTPVEKILKVALTQGHAFREWL
jgi:hypothetical protein